MGLEKRIIDGVTYLPRKAYSLYDKIYDPVGPGDCDRIISGAKNAAISMTLLSTAVCGFMALNEYFNPGTYGNQIQSPSQILAAASIMVPMNAFAGAAAGYFNKKLVGPGLNRLREYTEDIIEKKTVGRK